MGGSNKGLAEHTLTHNLTIGTRTGLVGLSDELAGGGINGNICTDLYLSLRPNGEALLVEAKFVVTSKLTNTEWGTSRNDKLVTTLVGHARLIGVPAWLVNNYIGVTLGYTLIKLVDMGLTIGKVTEATNHTILNNLIGNAVKNTSSATSGGHVS